MKFTTEHRALEDTVIKFCDKEINPFVAEWEAAEQFPSHALFKKLGNLGLMGLKYPEEFGGAGLDFSYSMVMAEALGQCNCGGVPMAIGVQTDMATPALARFGTDELRREYLAPTIAGDYVACLGVSEPGGGSDVAALKTSARTEGSDYVINGSKMWITNGLQADWCCLLANTSEGPAHKNKSLIVVPMDAKGITRQKIRKIGMHSSDTAQLFFDDVRVPRRNLIGQEGLGFTFQMLQFQEALRALVYRAVELYIGGKDVTRLASMAKLKCGRLSREVADSCLQYWGGMGYTADNPIAQAYRDSRLISIGGGADEVMLGILCKLEGTLPGRVA